MDPFGGWSLTSVSAENLQRAYDMADKQPVIRDLHHPELGNNEYNLC